jgi:hypothetical protein
VGTITGAHGGNPGYDQINQSAAAAYLKQQHKPSQFTGDTLRDLSNRAVEWLGDLGGKFQPPANDNDAIDQCLQELAKQLNKITHSHLTGSPDPDIYKVMVNANHKSCLVSLDAILQGAYAYNGGQSFQPGKRPKYDGIKDETGYFCAYLDAIGAVPTT